jgi:hypothetical protein
MRSVLHQYWHPKIHDHWWVVEEGAAGYIAPNHQPPSVQGYEAQEIREESSWGQAH